MESIKYDTDIGKLDVYYIFINGSSGDYFNAPDPNEISIKNAFFGDIDIIKELSFETIENIKFEILESK